MHQLLAACGRWENGYSKLGWSLSGLSAGRNVLSVPAYSYGLLCLLNVSQSITPAVSSSVSSDWAKPSLLINRNARVIHALIISANVQKDEIRQCYARQPDCRELPQRQ